MICQGPPLKTAGLQEIALVEFGRWRWLGWDKVHSKACFLEWVGPNIETAGPNVDDDGLNVDSMYKIEAFYEIQTRRLSQLRAS